MQTEWRKRSLGSTGFVVDPLCFGTAEIGGLNNVLDPVDEERAGFRLCALSSRCRLPR